MWMRELAGWLGAVLLGVVTMGQVASTARAELLFRDGDSFAVALLARSLTDGEAFDWALSTVLFIPETLAYLLLWLPAQLLPIGVDAVLATAGVLNIAALYGALRFAAGRRRTGRAPVAWALVAVAALCAIAATETSASRDSLELASLLLTTTYYSATVIATVMSIGIVRRAFDRDAAGRALPVWLGVVAGVSMLSNPLFAAWTTVPLGVILAIAAVYPSARERALPLLGGLAAGTAAGLLGRIPLSAWIANDGTSYADPSLWPESAAYYGARLGERLASPLGVIGCLFVVALLVFAIVATRRAADAGARVVAAAAWVVPLVVAVGMLALGTHASRYLEPVVFAPVLALVATPVAVRVPRRARVMVPAAAAVLLVAGGALSVPRTITAANAGDADLACVNDWVTASGQTGGGQFWTVRLPKLHLDDASQLVQVDHRLNGYAWLVNRTDFAVGEVTFLIEDSASSYWELGTDDLPADAIDCGRYTIYDFTPTTLPLGPAHS